MSDPSPYRVHCYTHGNQFLTREQYSTAMDNPNDVWHCPVCGENGWWDDSWYENFLGAQRCFAKACPPESQTQVSFLANGMVVHSCETCPWSEFTEIDLDREDYSLLLRTIGIDKPAPSL